MFSTNLKMIAYASEDMQKMIRRVNEQISKAEDALTELRQLSGMEESIHNVRKTLQSLEDERASMVSMMNSLMEIKMCYRQYENQITDMGIQKIPKDIR